MEPHKLQRTNKRAGNQEEERQKLILSERGCSDYVILG